MTNHPPYVNYQHLVQMVNDICNFFQAEADYETAVTSVAKHIRSFWAPRMRQHIIAHLHAGGEGMSALAQGAVRRLEQDAASKSGYRLGL